MIIAEVKNDLTRQDSVHKSYNNLKNLSLSIVHNLSVYYLFKLSKYTLKKQKYDHLEQKRIACNRNKFKLLNSFKDEAIVHDLKAKIDSIYG
jgi:hypothetical protein